MEYRYFKMKWEHPLIKESYANYKQAHADFIKKLDKIFLSEEIKDRTICKNDWYGSTRYATAFLVKNSKEDIEELKKIKGYKLSYLNEEYYTLTGNKRYKEGKALEVKLEELNNIIANEPDENFYFAYYILNRLGLDGYLAIECQRMYRPAVGFNSDWLFMKLPISEENDSLNGYTIHPDLIEIKQSEFLALQGL